MSNTLVQHGSSSTQQIDDERAQKVAAARKKLKTFRQARSTSTKSSNSTSSSKSQHSTTSSSPALQPVPLPLTINNGDNIPTPPRSPVRAKGKEKECGEPETPNRLKKQRSKGSMGGHRRQQSSVSGGFNGGPARMSGMGAFEMPSTFSFTDSSLDRLAPSPPSGKSIAPETPMTDLGAPGASENGHERNKEEVKARLSTFSFGSKSATSTRAHSPNPSPPQPLLQSQALASYDAGLDLSPNGSLTHRTSYKQSTPSSRPPSLFLIRPTPVPFSTPSASGPSRTTLAPGSTSTSPSSPITPARSRKHSHTRSNSISLPNLKLTSRPVSLGIPTSPSFPSSPCSPASGNSSETMPPINGTRLKFEPSGRGAEAEREKAEYRRKALEKLTGGVRTPPMVELVSAEISLPDLDDEDTESVASSARPFSGAFGAGFTFGRPNSLGVPSTIQPSTSPSPIPGDSLSSSPFFWSSPGNLDDTLPTDRWSGFSIPDVSPKDEVPNFGMNLPLPTRVEVPQGLGLGMSVNKRPSLTRNLSVLAEVDEPEEGESIDLSNPDVFSTPAQVLTRSLESDNADDNDDTGRTFVPIVQPTPSRLRELHLLSTAGSTIPAASSRPDTFSFPRNSSKAAPASPPKAYGGIGRGRPRPLSGIPSSIFSPPTTSSSSTPITGVVATPRSGPARRGKATSKGSSISYKKDGEEVSGAESMSSRWSSECSVGSRGLFSPPLSMSPPLGGSGSGSGSGSGGMISPRLSGGKGSGIVRPCPRPKSLVGLGLIEGKGSNRVLGEVDEEEEYEALGRRVMQEEEEGEVFGWDARDAGIEMERERDALREDVEIWRERYRSLEERLEGEKRESGLLRERLRKLSDRLSSFSLARASSSTPSPERDVTGQIFTLTASLEAERRDKENALVRVAELEEMLRRGSYQSSTPITTPYSNSSPQTLRPFSSPIITPATPLPDSSPLHSTSSQEPEDTNHDRMKAWGFPRQPSNSSITSRSKARESFFGLSNLVQRDAARLQQDEWAVGMGMEDGLDLPPLPNLLGGEFRVGTKFGQDVSRTDPLTPIFPAHNEDCSVLESSNVEGDLMGGMARSVSSGTTSAISYLATYLPSSITSPSPGKRMMELPRPSLPLSGVINEGNGVKAGVLDFRKGCNCCMGDVFDF